MYDAGLIPERATDASQAFAAWQRDGASILVTGGRTEVDLLEATHAVFAGHLLAEMPPSKVAPNPVPDQEGYDPASRTILANAAETLELHDDGHRAFGDRYPDLVCLLCARQAPEGGASFLVDGRRLVDGITADPERTGLAHFLWEQPIDQTVPAPNSPPPPPSTRPLAARTPEGRLSIRYFKLLEAPQEPAGATDHLAEWVRLGREEAAAAPRFSLQPGDLLCIDNYRAFHGRDPYTGPGRLLHRVIGWTDASFGLPPGAGWVRPAVAGSPS